MNKFSNQNLKSAMEKYEGADGIIYSNITITNSDNTFNTISGQPTDAPTVAEITDIRGDSIVTNPEDFFLTVARFSIPLFSVPLINYANYIQPGQANINLTNQSFTLSYNGFNAQVFLIFIPASIPYENPPVGPVPAIGAEQSVYYYLYEYILFIQMCNTALLQAFVNLGLLVGLPGGSIAPYLIYDPVTQLVSLIIDPNYLYTNVTPIQIWFNNQLSQFLYAIPNMIVTTNSALGKYNMFYCTNTYNNSYVIPDPPGMPTDGYIISQQYQSLGYWNSFKSLIITSNSLPIKPETVPPSGLNIYTSNAQLGTTNINTSIILQDYIPDLLNQAGNFNSIAVYSPGFSDYRLINLFSSSPIRLINILVQWIDTYGNIFPIYLLQGQAIYIKLAFIPKKFYLDKRIKY